MSFREILALVNKKVEESFYEEIGGVGSFVYHVPVEGKKMAERE